MFQSSRLLFNKLTPTNVKPTPCTRMLWKNRVSRLAHLQNIVPSANCEEQPQLQDKKHQQRILNETLNYHDDDNNWGLKYDDDNIGSSGEASPSFVLDAVDTWTHGLFLIASSVINSDIELLW